MQTFTVDNSLLKAHIAKKFQTRWGVFAIIVLIILSLQYIINDLSDIPAWALVATVGVIFAAYYLGLQMQKSDLLKFGNATYTITDLFITQTISTGKTSQFAFKEIVVVHNIPEGLLLIRGDKWTKLDYLRPRKGDGSYGILSDKTIFIPSITENYNTIAETVMHLASNATKL